MKFIVEKINIMYILESMLLTMDDIPQFEQMTKYGIPLKETNKAKEMLKQL